MNDNSEKFRRIVEIFEGGDPKKFESSMLDLISYIEDSPAHEKLQEDLQFALDDLTRRVITRSWTGENLAMSFFVFGKAAIYPNGIDVTKIASLVMAEVSARNEARQILVAIENQVLADRDMDLNAAGLVLDFLRSAPECWGADVELLDRVIEELSEILNR